ncbi:hypothetical protein [Comamonas sp. JC664]|uniref:hypothetical protein n=1 Tax=Comamonas sp. JC664 TaxID=2801917 RepID=UPI003623884E
MQRADAQRGSHELGAGLSIAVTNVIGFMVAGLHLQGLPPHSLGYIWLPAWPPLPPAAC